MRSSRSHTPLVDFAAMSCAQRRALVARYSEAFPTMASSLPAIDRDDLKPLLAEVAKELNEMIDELAEGKSGGEVMVSALSAPFHISFINKFNVTESDVMRRTRQTSADMTF